MFQKVLIYSGLWMSLVLNAGAAQEQWSNPGFESGLSQWTVPETYKDQISVESELSHTGKQSLKIDAVVKPNTPFAVKAIDDITPGLHYKFSVWARVAPGSSTMPAAIKYEWYNAQGVNTGGEYSNLSLPSTGEWKLITVEGEAQKDTTHARIYLRVFGKAIVLFDDFTVAVPEISILEPRKSAITTGQSATMTYQLIFKDAWSKPALPEINADVTLLNPTTLKPTTGQTLKTQVKKVSERQFAVTVPLPVLGQGDYLLQFHARNDGTELRTESGAYLFTKVASRRPESLSDTGTLLHNGTPFFPIGMYHPRVQDYELLSQNGFNAVQGNASQVDLDAAQKHGLAIDVVLYGGMRVAENLKDSLEKVRKFAGHPALLNWKIIDEPDAHQGTAHEVPTVYRALKAADSRNPIELTLDRESSLGLWSNFSDIVQIDRYPVPGRPLTLVSDFTREAFVNKQPWQNLQFVVQCGWQPDLKNQPTVAQARSMVYLALIEGAKGIWWYSMYDPGWDLTKTPFWQHMKGINAEIKLLSEPIMLGKHVDEVRSDQQKVLFRAFEYQGKTYLLVTNPHGEPTQVNFTLPKNLRRWRLLNGNNEGAISGQSMRVSLEGTDSRTFILEE